MSMGSAKKWMRLGGVAVCGLALTGGWRFYDRSIVPMTQEKTEALRNAGELTKRIEGAQETIAGIRAQEKGAVRIREETERLHAGLPEGSAQVWIPALVKEHFSRCGIAVQVVRLNATQDEPDSPAYEHGYWSVALPIDATGRNIASLLLGVADFERQNSFITVLDFAIRPDPENPGGRVGLLNLGAIVRKQTSR